ncbi:bifunctional D-glycero-beta-D-manno-heptose-7-phosphate kinase/D-glycero-beta-D-manno-heptose 1-phosphate adenylyltransferase HldE [Janthinobacterium lividum]|uniref:bifunctional D-glycero-beta-D-manno-heptose-7-phosphate kinase/D-glycero-beta-D-manno-heptose 1-phosphate adenylyltransferase HldE n=1 Tax=Janthinobacterium lividum TaxID=29581 RepID=UPI001B82A675|nr:bifunctional D-glycero-beta-D-manno-heptose-7-phosphate kinase/D-glycero-beta-D-manno-heptose 1-phosphate adenylyltransferase HldE [Janthinobacterium lividum]MBR7633447.1 bifunctional D-glycero-beta-D-manno-heptose-7-phosphate kinase/D-glycero-beta-D-manno-heptose 1-phosphate adenylyltransferase HldE [Janthinobacterium lividum]
MSNDGNVGLQLNGARVLVMGDLMLDRYWFGSTGRISPEAPVPVVNIAKDDLRPGGAANVAVNVASLGGQVTLLGVVGNDEPAELLSKLLIGHGVNIDFVRSDSNPTITKLRVVSRNQQLIRLDFESSFYAAQAFDESEIFRRYCAALPDVETVILSDYGKGTLSNIEPLIKAAIAQGKHVIVDPKGSDYQKYAGASLITPNMSEFELVAGHCTDEAEIVSKGTALRNELALGALLITRSEHGMTLLQPGATPLHVPTEAREVFDVTGAGDTVIATIGVALAAGKDLVTACRLGNLAAGIVVGKFGTATVTSLELERVMHLPGDEPSSVLREEDLLQRVLEAKAAGKRIVFTNGCFDILHVGHVRYLAAAKLLGDLLVVAVNDDASVKRLKGDARPVNHCSDRMQVLAGLKSVDWVVQFSESTPERLINLLVPDILVKGGDYVPEKIVGYDTVKNAGGKVIALEFHNGYSTTKILERSQLK